MILRGKFKIDILNLCYRGAVDILIDLGLVDKQFEGYEGYTKIEMDKWSDQHVLLKGYTKGGYHQTEVITMTKFNEILEKAAELEEENRDLVVVNLEEEPEKLSYYYQQIAEGYMKSYWETHERTPDTKLMLRVRKSSNSSEIVKIGLVNNRYKVYHTIDLNLYKSSEDEDNVLFDRTQGLNLGQVKQECPETIAPYIDFVEISSDKVSEFKRAISKFDDYLELRNSAIPFIYSLDSEESTVVTNAPSMPEGPLIGASFDYACELQRDIAAGLYDEVVKSSNDKLIDRLHKEKGKLTADFRHSMIQDGILEEYHLEAGINIKGESNSLKDFAENVCPQYMQSVKSTLLRIICPNINLYESLTEDPTEINDTLEPDWDLTEERMGDTSQIVSFVSIPEDGIDLGNIQL